MVIGKGMMAKAFAAYINKADVTIFASGVSNSSEQNQEAFQREERLLCDAINNYSRTSVIVYFSTCSIYDRSVNKTPYVRHKLKMESIVSENTKQFYIFRLPQVIGKTSSKTLIKVLFDKIQNEECFDLWIDSYRNLIDIDDVVLTIGFIIQNNLFKNEITHIASPFNTPVLEIVKIIEMILNKRANYAVVKKGANYAVELGRCMEIYNRLGIRFSEDYIKKTIEKYYTNSFVNNRGATGCLGLTDIINAALFAVKK